MSSDAQSVLSAALALPPDEQAHLLAVLLDSLGATDPSKVDMAWREEIRRRLTAFRAGGVECHTVEDVERDAEELIARTDRIDIAATG